MLETILGNHRVRRETQENRDVSQSSALHNHVQVKQSHCRAPHCYSQQKAPQTERWPLQIRGRLLASRVEGTQFGTKL